MHKLNNRSVATFGILRTERRVLETSEFEVEINDSFQWISAHKPAAERIVESGKTFKSFQKKTWWNEFDFFSDYGPEMYNLLSTEKVRARKPMKTFYSYLNVVVSQYQHYADCKHSVRNDTNEEPKQTREKKHSWLLYHSSHATHSLNSTLHSHKHRTRRYYIVVRMIYFVSCD